MYCVSALVLIANVIVNFVSTGPVLKTIFFPKKSEKNGTEANIKIDYNSPNSQLFSQIISNRFPKGINVRQLKATLSNEFPFL